MSCECHQIGGRFIAEDPDCPAHGTAAQAERESERSRRELIIAALEAAEDTGDGVYDAAMLALDYLRSLE